MKAYILKQKEKNNKLCNSIITQLLSKTTRTTVYWGVPLTRGISITAKNWCVMGCMVF